LRGVDAYGKRDSHENMTFFYVDNLKKLACRLAAPPLKTQRKKRPSLNPHSGIGVSGIGGKSALDSFIKQLRPYDVLDRLYYETQRNSERIWNYDPLSRNQRTIGKEDFEESQCRLDDRTRLTRPT
jgi:hypothetical protein